MTTEQIRAALLGGLVIPAHPLALTADRLLDERRQRALSRYYLAAGAGGLAVGVHTTQFAIHRPDVGLFKKVLSLAAEEALAFSPALRRAPVLIAGVTGSSRQALWEAQKACDAGFHACMPNLGPLSDASRDELLEHCRKIAEILPIVGFYLQPSAGGRFLSYGFWRHFMDIENVVALKVAPFNRYQTLDVVRALAASGREEEIALYTGNDDSIVSDLLTEFHLENRKLHFAGGLLGQWAVWTRKAVEMLDRIKTARSDSSADAAGLLALGARLTDANGAIFDARNCFSGCIPGIHEVLRRQGLLEGVWCIDPSETLSPWQAEEIERVGAAYPEFNDDDFVKQHLSEWLQ